MKAKELIGKVAIRTKPITYETGIKDGSYCSEPLFIANATDSHIVCVYVRNFMKGREHILNYLWCDDNWIPYSTLKIPLWVKILKWLYFREGGLK